MADMSNKEKLMQAALELFSRKGYSAASVDEIAESVGIKGPNIYKHFAGKRDLLDELVEHFEARYKEKMRFNLDSLTQVRNAQDLRDLSMNQLKYTLSDDDAIRLRKMFTIEQFRDENMSMLSTRHQYTNVIVVYEKIFTDLLEYKEIKNGAADILALEYISPINLLIQLCDRNSMSRDEVIDKSEKHIDYFTRRHFVNP